MKGNWGKQFAKKAASILLALVMCFSLIDTSMVSAMADEPVAEQLEEAVLAEETELSSEEVTVQTDNAGEQEEVAAVTEDEISEETEDYEETTAETTEAVTEADDAEEITDSELSYEEETVEDAVEETAEIASEDVKTTEDAAAQVIDEKESEEAEESTATVAGGSKTALLAASKSTALGDFTTTAEIEDASQVDGTYQIIGGRTYTVNISFKESNDLQFDDDSSLTYTVPNGFKADAGNYTLDIVCNQGRSDEFTVYGNPYTVDENGNITFTWNTNDSNFQRLAGMNNAQFVLQLKGTFDGTQEQIDFGNEVVVDLDVDTNGDVNISKYGSYDKSKNVMNYTLTVTSTGNSENVVVTDSITGNALTYNNDVKSDPSTGSVTTSSDTGFTYTIQSMTDGQTVRLTYSAAVDTSKLNGKGSESNLSNEATVTSTGDPDGDTAYNNTSDIEYTGFSKSAGDAVVSGNTSKVTWTATYNKGYAADVSGNTVTDTIDVNGTDTEISGDVTVNIYSSDGTKAGTATATVSSDGKTFEYTIPSTYGAGYYYEFVYTTETDVSDMVTDTTISNTISDGLYESSKKATIGPPSENKIGVSKEATSVSGTEIT